jgi:uncharacterized protein YeaO (DUF488 family)
MTIEHMPLDEWRRDVAPKLDRIEWYAMRAIYYAKFAKEECEKLPAKPYWDSHAQGRVDAAIASLAAALKTMVAARRIYKGKPPVV